MVCPRVECQLGGLRLSVASLFSLARTDVPERAGEGSHVSLCSNEYTLSPSPRCFFSWLCVKTSRHAGLGSCGLLLPWVSSQVSASVRASPVPVRAGF